MTAVGPPIKYFSKLEDVIAAGNGDGAWVRRNGAMEFVPESTYEQVANKNVPNGYAGLDAGGLLASSTIPPLGISQVYTVASQAAMLALVAQRGDVAVRTDLNQNFILSTDDPTQLVNWVELLTPAAPVQSVSGKTGNVILAAADVGLGNVTNDAQLKATQLDVDGTLAANSDTRVASQKAVKTYVDAHAGGGSSLLATPQVKATTQLQVTSASSATPNAHITTADFLADGGSYDIRYSFPMWQPDSTVDVFGGVYASTDGGATFTLQRIIVRIGANANLQKWHPGGVHSVRLSPAAGNIRYRIGWWSVSSTNAFIYAGSDTVGGYMPATLDVLKIR